MPDAKKTGWFVTIYSNVYFSIKKSNFVFSDNKNDWHHHAERAKKAACTALINRGFLTLRIVFENKFLPKFLVCSCILLVISLKFEKVNELTIIVNKC